MNDVTDTHTEMRLLGQALAVLREEAKLTQEEAGERCRPPFSRQAWHAHEAGRVKGILEPDVQRRLLSALGATPEALRMARQKVAEHGGSVRIAARAAAGMRERAGKVYELEDQRQAVFPLQTGDAVLVYPTRMPVEAIDELERYLSMFIQTARSRAAN
ncbi:MAG: helix-turn-helix transcriptional regulator [Caulobacter sp.]|nr:helix-turn-helix transcriptional regulator [Caulobacter sp.]